METFDVSKDFEFDKIIGDTSKSTDIDDKLVARADVKQQKKWRMKLLNLL